MNKFKELVVWQRGVKLAKTIYELTSKFPKEEKYGITSQINRAAVSISSNIAEGAGRESNKEFSHFLSISIGSSFELETQLAIAKEIGFVSDDNLKILTKELDEIQKMLTGLKKSLK